MKSDWDSQISAVLIQDAGWIGGQYAMGRAYSLDLREPVVSAGERRRIADALTMSLEASSGLRQ
jgi:hypothetical protein